MHKAVGLNALQLLPELIDSINDAITAIEKGDLYERMCCNGYMCGCRGSDNADFLVHCLRETLAKAIAIEARSDETGTGSAEGESAAPTGIAQPQPPISKDTNDGR